MSSDDTIADLDFVRPRKEMGRRGPVIRTAETLTVCRSIERDRTTAEAARFELSVADRWSILTEPLPLVGAQAMTPAADGAFPRLDALAAASPWAIGLVADVEWQVRTQLATGRPWMQIEPTLLFGPPGVGKTWLARQLGAALDLPTATLELGGASDDRALAGTARGYTNTIPCWPLVVIARTATANPLLVLDEVDKAGGSNQHGRPHHALLAMLEPASARAYHDQCLLADADISRISWIACANHLDAIPPPLLSRFRVVELPRPSADHFDAALTSITDRLAAEWQIAPGLIPDLPARAVKILRGEFARTGSVRQLARHARALLGAALADRGGPTRH